MVVTTGQTVRQRGKSATVAKVEPGFTTIRLQDGTSKRLPNALILPSVPGSGHQAPSFSLRFAWIADVPAVQSSKSGLSVATKPAAATTK